MNIIVCAKQVPNTTQVRIDRETGTLIRQGVESIMNPDDKIGLELALDLKAEINAHITVISMGPMQATEMLREALAMGADEAILLNDRAFAGSDTLATSTILAAAIKKLEVDLVIAGRQAIDGDTAQVGPQMAEWLDIPNISYVQHLDLDIKNKKITVERLFEHSVQIQRTTLPALITAIDGLASPRYMTPKGIFEAFEKDILIWGVDDIVVDRSKIGLKGSPTKVRKSYAKEHTGKGKIINVDPEAAVAEILKIITENFIL